MYACSQHSKQNSGQRSWIPTASIKRPDSLQLQHVSPIIALAVRAATDPELLQQNRSRQGAEIGANPDGSGRGKIPGFGGRRNLCTFQYKSYSKLDDFGSEQAPGSFRGFSGGPRRDVQKATRTDLQDDQRHDPRALVHHVFLLSRCLWFSCVSLSLVLFRLVLLPVVAVDKIFFRPEIGSDLLSRPEVGSENSNSTSGRSRWTQSRPRSSRSSSVNRRRSTVGIGSSTHSKTRAPPQPQRE